MSEQSLEINEFFQRQIQIPNFNQEKLDLNVLIAGLGGTGTHIALACVRLGITNLSIIDNDKIEASNLNRQILYQKKDIGEFKAEVGKKNLNENNLISNIQSFNLDIFQNWQEFLKLLENSDFLFCCLDLPVIKRLAVACACLYYGKPMIYAGIDVIHASSGMILYQPSLGNPCYECLEACLPQLKLKDREIFNPRKIVELNRIEIEKIQKSSNIIASSNYFIASIISNLAVNVMIQHVQSQIKLPNRIIFDGYNWELKKFFLKRSKYCEIC